ncbi:helix-turn-helix domain-containing protein [Phytoactinopolyspora endophytica]|uniref:helix-turn-helix domain-containing protein n=1 Tax=Phytoactinopolyspora endophytica TaxID=1642495 RepID=UPI00101BB71F|nr:helix-turn-helix transcriptional regulator [Phytoactinopolyspora endophytica]
MDDEQLARNRDAQAELYGAPLRELFRRLIDTFGLTQSQLASTVGVSAPMLSQLMGARRVKMGNPAAMQRIHALSALADEAEAGQVSPEELKSRIDEIRSVSGVLTSSSYVRSTDSAQTTTAKPSPDDVVAAIRGLLRAVASGQELHDVAAALVGDHPGLAELIRVYGVGRQEDAVDHYRRHEHLL